MGLISLVCLPAVSGGGVWVETVVRGCGGVYGWGVRVWEVRGPTAGLDATCRQLQ